MRILTGLLCVALSGAPTNHARADDLSDATESVVYRILQIRDDVCPNAPVNRQLTCRREYARAIDVARGLELTERSKRALYVTSDQARSEQLQNRIDDAFKEIDSILATLRARYVAGDPASEE